MEEYYTSPITPTIIFLLFALFSSHKPLLKFSSLYVTRVLFSSVRVCQFLILFPRLNVNLTGYWPIRDNGCRWNRLLFDGNEERYEIRETKFLGHLRSLGRKDTTFGLNHTGDDERIEEPYLELVEFLDDKSLSLVMEEAADNGRKSLYM